MHYDEHPCEILHVHRKKLKLIHFPWNLSRLMHLIYAEFLIPFKNNRPQLATFSSRFSETGWYPKQKSLPFLTSQSYVLFRYWGVDITAFQQNQHWKHVILLWWLTFDHIYPRLHTNDVNPHHKKCTPPPRSYHFEVLCHASEISFLNRKTIQYICFSNMKKSWDSQFKIVILFSHYLQDWDIPPQYIKTFLMCSFSVKLHVSFSSISKQFE